MLALANCYRVFNEKGGRALTLQSGQQVYFPKAIVLAIYADYPATQKVESNPDGLCMPHVFHSPE